MKDTLPTHCDKKRLQISLVCETSVTLHGAASHLDYLLLILNDKLACQASPIRLSLRVFFAWEWLGPGGLPGLQNLWRVALRAAVGSTPIHSRLLFHEKTLKVFIVKQRLNLQSDSVNYISRHARKPLGTLTLDKVKNVHSRY